MKHNAKFTAPEFVAAEFMVRARLAGISARISAIVSTGISAIVFAGIPAVVLAKAFATEIGGPVVCESKFFKSGFLRSKILKSKFPEAKSLECQFLES